MCAFNESIRKFKIPLERESETVIMQMQRKRFETIAWHKKKGSQIASNHWKDNMEPCSHQRENNRWG